MLSRRTQCTIPYFLVKHCDCVVQAPTGSGKTLAYLLPTIQIVSDRVKSKSSERDGPGKFQICALVIVPGRELVEQVGKLFKPICDETGLRLMKLVGGVKRAKIEKIAGEGTGHGVLISTPGRLQTLLDTVPALKTALKALEVLIIDEADRFSHTEFASTMTSILAALPKQRRTGLFSATQAKEAEELMRYGLRNPVRINVRSSQPAEIHEGTATSDGAATAGKSLVTPSELTNYYWEVPADKKFLALALFLNKVAAESKVLLFLCSAAGVEYLAQILPPLLEGGAGHKVLALHRKKKGKREKILSQFRSATDKCILLSTDLMARGVDVIDIDWVVQYDLPKHSSLLVHRGGRSGRNGRLGQSLFMLTPEETAYVEFVNKHEGIKLNRWEAPFQLRDKAAEKLRRRVQDMAVADRRVLEAGSAAFVSYVQAYLKHDCQLVCRLKDLDLVGVANSVGLLRLPQMKELKKRQDLAEFQPRIDISTSTIAYADDKLEVQRQAAKAEKRRRSDPAAQQLAGDSQSASDEKATGRKRAKRAPDWAEFDADSKLLKKFKRGKMSRGELDGLLV